MEPVYHEYLDLQARYDTAIKCQEELLKENEELKQFHISIIEKLPGTILEAFTEYKSTTDHLRLFPLNELKTLKAENIATLRFFQVILNYVSNSAQTTSDDL